MTARKSPTAQVTMPPRYHDAAARLAETLGEPSLSALVRRLIDDRMAALPRRDMVVKADDGRQVQRSAPLDDDLIPRPPVVRERLALVHQEAARLRRLLRLSEAAAVDRAERAAKADTRHETPAK